MNSPDALFELLPEINLELRASGTPVGISNEGNTCYFSVILQALFHNPSVLSAVLTLPDQAIPSPSSSLRFVHQLKALFARMSLMDCKFLSPKGVLRALSQGKELQFGDQQDLGEMYLAITSRLVQGLQAHSSQQGFQNLFEGILVRQILKDDDRTLTPSGEEAFSMLFVDINSLDMMDALDKFFINRIEDSKCTVHFSIKRLPDTLLVQLQRATFSKHSVQPQKNNKHFPVPLSLDLGKYLSGYRGKLIDFRWQFEQHNRRVQRLRQQIVISESLDYKGSNILQQVKQVRTQIAKLIYPQSQDQKRVAQKLPLNRSDVQNYAKGLATLTRLEAALTRSTGRSHAQLHSLQQRGLKMHVQLPVEVYQLSAALMHRGRADSGHYFAYLRDNSVWRKYDDQQVTATSAEQVVSQASGIKDTNAYYLIYKRTDSKPLPARTYPLSSQPGYGDDPLSDLISPALKRIILRQNEQFFIQLNRQESNLAIVSIVSDYKNILIQARKVLASKPSLKLTGKSATQNAMSIFGSQSALRRAALCLLLPRIKQIIAKQPDFFMANFKRILKSLPDQERIEPQLIELQSMKACLLSGVRAALACEKLCDSMLKRNYTGSLISSALLLEQTKTLWQKNRNIYGFMRQTKVSLVKQSLKSVDQREQKLAISFAKKYLLKGQAQRLTKDQLGPRASLALVQARQSDIEELQSWPEADLQRQYQQGQDQLRIKIQRQAQELKLI